MPISETYNMDCMEYMRSIPDKFFELAIVDPPYGLDAKSVRCGGGKYKNSCLARGDIRKWDIRPQKEYFDELFRVSRNQIIWEEIIFRFLRLVVLFVGIRKEI